MAKGMGLEERIGVKLTSEERKELEVLARENFTGNMSALIRFILGKVAARPELVGLDKPANEKKR